MSIVISTNLSKLYVRYFGFISLMGVRVFVWLWFGLYWWKVYRIPTFVLQWKLIFEIKWITVGYSDFPHILWIPNIQWIGKWFSEMFAFNEFNNLIYANGHRNVLQTQQNILNSVYPRRHTNISILSELNIE